MSLLRVSHPLCTTLQHGPYWVEISHGEGGMNACTALPPAILPPIETLPKRAPSVISNPHLPKPLNKSKRAQPVHLTVGTELMLSSGPDSDKPICQVGSNGNIKWSGWQAVNLMGHVGSSTSVKTGFMPDGWRTQHSLPYLVNASTYLTQHAVLCYVETSMVRYEGLIDT